MTLSIRALTIRPNAVILPPLPKLRYEHLRYSGIWYGFSMGRTDPWQAFAREHRQDERITATVTKTTDFGIFVGLEGGIEGIVHVGDLSWWEPGEVAIKRFTDGDVVDALILSIDVERQRVSLGIKPIDNPYEALAGRYAVGERVVGRVREIEFRKLVVDLPGGLAGIVRLSNSTIREAQFEVGAELALVIREIWPRRGLVELTLAV